MKKGLLILLALVFAFSLAACSSGNNEGANNAPEANNTAENEPAVSEADAPAEKEDITLKFFTALADRSNGAGKVEQEIIDNYMKLNPNVKIEVEALQDEPYKTKIKVYAASSDMPDIMQVWGQPVFIDPLIQADKLLELNPADFNDKNFVAGAMEGFSGGGKLYGVPRGTDFFVLFYNKKLFADNGVTPPATTADLLAVAKQFREKGINPIAFDGMDGWPFPIWFEYMLQRETGDFNFMDKAMKGEASFNDPAVIAAAKNMQELAKAKGFADGFLTADYGASRNLFGQEQAAMYMMGSWEAGLATDENFSASFRENVGALAYPASANAKATDTAAWYGGGYSVSKTSKHPEAAVEFLKYFFQPENWAKLTWQAGAGFPAQKFDEFLTGSETNLQKDLIAIFSNMTSSSNTPVLDTSTDKFKQDIMSLHQKLTGDQISPEDFAKELDAAAAAARQ